MQLPNTDTSFIHSFIFLAKEKRRLTIAADVHAVLGRAVAQSVALRHLGQFDLLRHLVKIQPGLALLPQGRVVEVGDLTDQLTAVGAVREQPPTGHRRLTARARSCSEEVTRIERMTVSFSHKLHISSGEDDKNSQAIYIIHDLFAVLLLVNIILRTILEISVGLLWCALMCYPWYQYTTLNLHYFISCIDVIYDVDSINQSINQSIN